MANATQVNDHVARAIARLLEQYKNSPRIKGVITSLVTEIQGLENTFFDLKDNRTIDNATGATLNSLGALVGVPRKTGELDTPYRGRIKAGIFKNRSQGTSEILIETVEIFTDSTIIIFSEGAEASFAFWIDDSTLTQPEIDALWAGLRAAKAAGVEIEGVTSFDTTNPFGFTGGTLNNGFGSAADAIVGGKFASLNVES